MSFQVAIAKINNEIEYHGGSNNNGSLYLWLPVSELRTIHTKEDGFTINQNFEGWDHFLNYLVAPSLSFPGIPPKKSERKCEIKVHYSRREKPGNLPRRGEMWTNKLDAVKKTKNYDPPTHPDTHIPQWPLPRSGALPDPSPNPLTDPLHEILLAHAHSRR